MKHWDLMTLQASTEKQTPREPGADSARVPSSGRQIPRVLFSSPECRAIVLDLAQGQSMDEHQVRERAVVQVVTGRVQIDCAGTSVECSAGGLITFEPGERHSVHANEDARLLLLLAPWPAPDHVTDVAEGSDRQHLPANATVDPIVDATHPA